MKYQLDQSNRIEQTTKDTYVAIANELYAFVIKIPAKHKRILMEAYRIQGLTKLWRVELFIIAISICVSKSTKTITTLIIDQEYPGYEESIRSQLNTLHPNTQIMIHSIGKASPAHKAAYGTHLKRRKPDYIVTMKDIVNAQKKIESPDGT